MLARPIAVRSLTVLALLCLPVSAMAHGVNEHDGFLLRLSGGFGAASSNSVTADQEVAIGGAGGLHSIAFGLAIVPGLILNADFFGTSVLDPSFEVNGTKLGNISGTLRTSNLGIGLTSYLMPANIYLAGSVGLAVATFEFDGERKETETGLGANLMIGKEWWVTDNWGLGIAGQFMYSSVPSKNGGGSASDLASLAGGVLLSATYN